MRAGALLTLLLFAHLAMAQTTRKNPPTNVEKLCGKLVHSEDVPIKNSQNVFNTRSRNLPHIEVRLYRAEDILRCCDGLLLAAKTTTGRWGAFHFKEKGLTRGLYWIVVHPEGREYKLLLQYDAKKRREQLCSQTFWELNDAGDFWEAETVTLE